MKSKKGLGLDPDTVTSAKSGSDYFVTTVPRQMIRYDKKRQKKEKKAKKEKKTMVKTKDWRIFSKQISPIVF